METDQQIYITIGTVVLAEHRPKEGQLMHLVLAAEAREFFTGNVKRHCFVHRRSCLKTLERANVRQYRTIQSKVTRFRGLCKSLKSLRRLTVGLPATANPCSARRKTP